MVQDGDALRIAGLELIEEEPLTLGDEALDRVGHAAFPDERSISR